MLNIQETLRRFLFIPVILPERSRSWSLCEIQRVFVISRQCHIHTCRNCHLLALSPYWVLLFFCGSVLTHHLQFDGLHSLMDKFKVNIYFFYHLLFFLVLKSLVERGDGGFYLQVKGIARHLRDGNFCQKSSHFCKGVGGMDSAEMRTVGMLRDEAEEIPSKCLFLSQLYLSGDRFHDFPSIFGVILLPCASSINEVRFSSLPLVVT